MSSFTPISQSKLFFTKTQFRKNPHTPIMVFPNPNPSSTGGPSAAAMRAKKNTTVKATAAETAAPSPAKKRFPGEAKGFVEEMRFVAMKLHTRDQAREGEKEAEGPPVAKWDPSIDGYLRFLVDSKLVFETLEGIVERPAFPECKGFSVCVFVR